MFGPTTHRSSRLTAIACGLSLLAVSCGHDAATGPDAPSSDTAERDVAVAASPVDLRSTEGQLPMHVTASAVVLQQDFAPGFGPPTFGRSTFGGRCSTPSDFLIRFRLDGTATPLGQFTAIAEHCSVIDFLAGTGTETDGVAVFTAANGDELIDNYEGTNAPGQGFEEQHTFVGGTGRFANAAGGGVGRGICDRQAGTCVFSLDGTIDYDASDRGE